MFLPEAIQSLSSYSWPGNVGQLKAVVERLVWQRVGSASQDSSATIFRSVFGHDGASHWEYSETEANAGEMLFSELQTTGESFWFAVYPLFMKREITRADLRSL